MAHIYFFNELKLGYFFLPQWVKGHNNHTQNERCDILAVMASQQGNLSIDAFYEREEGKLL